MIHDKAPKPNLCCLPHAAFRPCERDALAVRILVESLPSSDWRQPHFSSFARCMQMPRQVRYGIGGIDGIGDFHATFWHNFFVM